MKKKRFNPAKVKRRLDRLFSSIILQRDQRTCQCCGKDSVKVDTSHIIPRVVLSTRWSVDNAVCLCVGCHKYGKESWHQNPLAAVRWLDEKYGTEKNNLLLSASLEPFTFNADTAAKIEGDLMNLLKYY